MNSDASRGEFAGNKLKLFSRFISAISARLARLIISQHPTEREIGREREKVGSRACRQFEMAFNKTFN